MVYCLVVVSSVCVCVHRNERIDGVSCCWLTGRVFRPKLSSVSAVTVEWWLLLPEHHLASLQQKDGSVVCTSVSTCGFAGIVCAGGWAAGAVMGTLCYRWKAFPCAGKLSPWRGRGSRVVEKIMEVSACAVLQFAFSIFGPCCYVWFPWEMWSPFWLTGQISWVLNMHVDGQMWRAS